MNDRRDDAKRLRLRDVDLAIDFSQAGRNPSLGMPCLLVETRTIKTYPTMALSFYACSPLTVLGAEVEGAEGLLTPMTSTLYALNLGETVPPTGTSVLATFVDNRWVFRFDG